MGQAREERLGISGLKPGSPEWKARLDQREAEIDAGYAAARQSLQLPPQVCEDTADAKMTSHQQLMRLDAQTGQKTHKLTVKKHDQLQQKQTGPQLADTPKWRHVPEPSNPTPVNLNKQVSALTTGATAVVRLIKRAWVAVKDFVRQTEIFALSTPFRFVVSLLFTALYIFIIWAALYRELPSWHLPSPPFLSLPLVGNPATRWSRGELRFGVLILTAMWIGVVSISARNVAAARRRQNDQKESEAARHD